MRRDSMAEELIPEGVSPNTGFSYLKRDLVRLLGVLCHDVKPVQDRVREAGGLPVIMNMCVIDERNPCQSTLSFIDSWQLILFFLQTFGNTLSLLHAIY